MSDPRKHHYIPAFYLRQWTTNGFLCEMRKVQGKVVVRSKAPDATGFQKDLYKIAGVPADIAQHFERTFMHMVDTEAANAMRKIRAGAREPWPVKEQDAWVRFLLSLIFRNPEAVAVVKEQLKRIWAEGIDSIRKKYEAHRHPGDPATFDQFLALTDPHAPAIAASNFLQRMMNSELLTNGILDLHWGRLTFPDSRWTLVTSDRPLDMSHGLVSKDAYIALPVGPRTLFAATRAPVKLDHLSASKQAELVRLLNEKTVRQARQYVWATDDSAQNFVRKYIATLPDRQLISDRAKELSERVAKGHE